MAILSQCAEPFKSMLEDSAAAFCSAWPIEPQSKLQFIRWLDSKFNLGFPNSQMTHYWRSKLMARVCTACHLLGLIWEDRMHMNSCITDVSSYEASWNGSKILFCVNLQPLLQALLKWCLGTPMLWLAIEVDKLLLSNVVCMRLACSINRSVSKNVKCSALPERDEGMMIYWSLQSQLQLKQDIAS